MTEPGPVGLGTDPLVAVLAHTMTSHPVQRVPIAALRAAFASFDPTGATQSDARARLATAVRDLERQGLGRLPAARRLWDRATLPPLPAWAERPPVARREKDPLPERVWRAELAQAGAVATTWEEYRTVEAVDAFLHSGGAVAEAVPHRSRSLQVFGHEKALDRLLRTRLFLSGALSLDLLRCYLPPLPLTAQHTGDAGSCPSLLVAENHSTYASMLTVARERAVSGSALAIGYGGGNQFPSSVVGATQLDPVPVLIGYFGDLDAKGLQIPRSAAHVARGAGLPAPRPAKALYRALLDEGRIETVVGAAIPEDLALDLAAWLDDPSLQRRAVEHLRAGRRLAQEAIGPSELRALPSWM